MQESSGVSRTIYLNYLNGTAFCLNADDYMRIRFEHRIVGSLVGTCNSCGLTPSSFGLPAEFNCYETRFLVEKDFVCLVTKDSLERIPTKVEQETYKSLIQKRTNEQMTYIKDRKLSEIKKKASKITAGKQKKLKRSGVDVKDINLTVEGVFDEMTENLKLDQQNALIEIPYEFPFPHEACYVELPNVQNLLKYHVFRDLWEKGMYVTSGETFGADFLVYPGDPLIFHASHIVIVLSDPTKITPTELIAKGRLAVSVNKVCMFAYYSNHRCRDISDTTFEIQYQIIQWEGCKDSEKCLNG